MLFHLSIYQTLKNETKLNIYLYCFHLLNFSQQIKMPLDQRQIYETLVANEYHSYITCE